MSSLLRPQICAPSRPSSLLAVLDVLSSTPPAAHSSDTQAGTHLCALATKPHDSPGLAPRGAEAIEALRTGSCGWPLPHALLWMRCAHPTKRQRAGRGVRHPEAPQTHSGRPQVAIDENRRIYERGTFIQQMPKHRLGASGPPPWLMTHHTRPWRQKLLRMTGRSRALPPAGLTPNPAARSRVAGERPLQ